MKTTTLIAFFKGTAGEYRKLGPMVYSIPVLAARMRTQNKWKKVAVTHV